MGELNNAFWQQPSSSYSIEYAGRFDFDGNSYMSKSSATATDRGKFTQKLAQKTLSHRQKMLWRRQK